MIHKKLHEYDRLDYEELNLDLAKANGLKKYLDNSGLRGALEFHSDHLKATQYVGVINYRGRRIDVLPKLLSGGVGPDNDEEIRLMQRNLLIMLSYTNHLHIKDSDLSNFDLGKDNLIDVFIYLFARDLVFALNKEVLHSYENKEENVSFIKGKISFHKDSVINQFNRSKTVCSFTSFEHNNIFNQTFYFLSEKLLALTNNSATKQYLNQALKCLEGVSRKQISYDQIKDKVVGRSFENFETPFNFAKVFLKNNRPSLSSGSSENYCLMFNMNNVFEEFIYSALNRNKIKLGLSRVEFQRNRTLFQSWIDLSTNDELGGFGSVRNDIYLEFSNKMRPPLIIDTKYKEVSSVKDVSSEDFFQLLTYRHIERKAGLLNTPEIKLVYPQKSAKIKARLTFSGQDKTLINVRTFPLRDLTAESIFLLLEEMLTA
ncbi:MAG: hypothetical protein V4598_16530 [Bdellovibrionota bacterium]